MTKYFCDYCDTYLTHDSPSVRKTHCAGSRHREAVRNYYQKWLEEQVQKLVDHASEAYKSGKVPQSMYGAPAQAPQFMAQPGLPRYPSMVPPAHPPGMPGHPMTAPLLPHPGMRPPPVRWPT